MYNITKREIGVNMKNKKNIGLALGLILSLCTFCSVYAQEEAVTEQKLQSAPEIKVDKDTPEDVVELIKKKDYDSALPLLNAYIESKPKKYIGYKLRGEVYYALRRYDLAAADFQKAVEIKTEDDKFVTGAKVISAVVLGADKKDQYQNPELGALYGQLMYAQKAVNDNMYEVSYKKALEYNSHLYLPAPKKADIPKINCPQKYGREFNPQGIDADIAAVIADIEKGDFSEAAYKIPKITSEYPDYYLGQYLTGVVMHGLEQEKNAIDAFTNSLKLNPYDFESYASLGLIYYEKAAKTFDKTFAAKSIEYFENALDLNPKCNTYYFYIGMNYLEFGDYGAAVENFKKALAIKTNDYNSMYYKAIAQYMQKDYAGTIDETTKMLYKHVSNYNSVLYLRALAYYKSNNQELAIADIEKIHQNMNDIFNADVKQLSAKDEVLDCYLYYLQSKISRDNGFGAKSDLQKAYKNPIIALLDTRSKDFAQVNFKITSSDIAVQYEYLITTFDDLAVGFAYLNPDYKLIARKDAGNDEEKLAELSQDKQEVPVSVASPSPVEPSQEDLTNDGQNSEEVNPQAKAAEDTDLSRTEADENVSSQAPVENDGEEVSPENNVQNSQTQTKSESESDDLSNDSAPEVLSGVEKPVVDNNSAGEITLSEPLAQDKKLFNNSPVIVFDPDTLIFKTPPEKTEVPALDDRIKSEQTEITAPEGMINTASVNPEVKEISDTSNITTGAPQPVSVSAQKEPPQQPEVEQPESKNVQPEIVSSKKDNLSDTNSDGIDENSNGKDTETVDKTADEQQNKQTELKQENEVNNQPSESDAVMQTPEEEENKESENKTAGNQENVTEEITDEPKVVKVNEKHAKVNLSEFNVKTLKTPEVKEGDEVVFLEPEPLFPKREEKAVKENNDKISLIPVLNSDSPKEEVRTEQTPSVPDKPVDVNITKTSDNLDKVTDKNEKKEEITLVEPEEIVFPEEIEKKESVQDVPQIIAQNEDAEDAPSVRDFSKEKLTEEQPAASNPAEELPEQSGDEKAVNSAKTQEEETAENVSPVLTPQNNEILPAPEEKSDLKQKKIKKSKNKTKDNLIIAVGGNADEYADKKEQKTKIKKEKQKKETSKKEVQSAENTAPLKDMDETALSDTRDVSKIKEDTAVSVENQDKKAEPAANDAETGSKSVTDNKTAEVDKSVKSQENNESEQEKVSIPEQIKEEPQKPEQESDKTNKSETVSDNSVSETASDEKISADENKEQLSDSGQINETAKQMPSGEDSSKISDNKQKPDKDDNKISDSPVKSAKKVPFWKRLLFWKKAD